MSAAENPICLVAHCVGGHFSTVQCKACIFRYYARVINNAGEQGGARDENLFHNTTYLAFSLQHITRTIILASINMLL